LSQFDLYLSKMHQTMRQFEVVGWAHMQSPL